MGYGIFDMGQKPWTQTADLSMDALRFAGTMAAARDKKINQTSTTHSETKTSGGRGGIGGVLGSVVGGIAGSFIPGIGTAIGTTLGSMVGGGLGGAIDGGGAGALQGAGFGLAYGSSNTGRELTGGVKDLFKSTENAIGNPSTGSLMNGWSTGKNSMFDSTLPKVPSFGWER